MWPEGNQAGQQLSAHYSLTIHKGQDTSEQHPSMRKNVPKFNSLVISILHFVALYVQYLMTYRDIT